MRNISQILHNLMGEKSNSGPSVQEINLAQLAFTNSSVANIIFSVDNGQIVLVNKAATKLFGYSKKIFLTKNTSEIFDIPERDLKKILKPHLITLHKPVIIANGLKKGNKSFPCEMNFAVFKDSEGIKNVIVSITDLSDSILKQLHIDLKKEKEVSDNIKLAKSNQKKIDTKKDKLVAKNIVLANSKQKGIDTKNKQLVATNISIAKSKQHTIDTKNKIIVENNIILAKEKSTKEKLNYETLGRKKVLLEIEENFKFMFNSSSEVLFDSDFITNTAMVNNAYETEFGYANMKNMTADDWATHIHPDDKGKIMKEYFKMLKSKDIEWKIGFRIIKADGSIANVLSSRIILRNSDSTPYRMIGSMQDISKQKVLEERLEQEIRLKEMQIIQATEDAKDTERSDIGKELHDNVNQLLGASKLYLDMAKRGGKDSEMYLSRSSEYTLTAIEEIRKLSKGLTTDIIKNLGLCVAIKNISRDTMEVNPVKIVLKVNDSIENSVNDKFKLNIYRIVQEQLNNILKHAKATRVVIKILQNKEFITLSISDNGIGFDTNKKRKGIGVANIKSRAASYNGTADFMSQPGSGCVLTATFSKSDKLLRRA
jgi:two-component system sensor histidine kinase UhpB